MNEKIKNLFFELKKEAEKEQIDILCGAYIKESQEQVLIVGGESRIQAILLMEILSVMESEECDCPNCRKRETDKKEQQANSELDILLNAFLRGELK